ncbi:hypothetical protein [Mycobacterium asiaticum]|nr:hypothetical protein [Mycobacterium asiaticum]
MSVLAAAVLVIVAVAIVSISGDESRSGGDIVKGYLNALAQGDAATA